MAIETGSEVSFEYVGRLPDGTVFDTSREAVAEEHGLVDPAANRAYEPLTVEVGSGEIIEGLDDGLVGLEVGDTETITIPPERAYGERREDLVKEHSREEFDQLLQGQAPEEGMAVQTQQGQRGELVHVDDEVVRVDFNHELAGETLEFEVEVVENN